MSVYRVVRKAPSEYERVAHENGWDVDRYLTLRQITDKADRNENLTDDDWRGLVFILLKAPNSEVAMKVRASTVLSRQKGTVREKDAIEVAKLLLKDNEDILVTQGLQTLKQLDAPGWQEDAEGLKKHKSPHVRTRVTEILAGSKPSEGKPEEKTKP